MLVLGMTSMGSTFTSVRSLRYVIYPVQVRAGRFSVGVAVRTAVRQGVLSYAVTRFAWCGWPYDRVVGWRQRSGRLAVCVSVVRR